VRICSEQLLSIAPRWKPLDLAALSNQMKITLAIYRIGGVLTLEIRLKFRKSSLPKLLVPLPMIWHMRLQRS
jgi:hypothetical protein